MSDDEARPFSHIIARGEPTTACPNPRNIQAIKGLAHLLIVTRPFAHILLPVYS